MEFKQLEMFVAVAELRSVQRAAERVFRTQQAVSMAMTKLEREAGTNLFDRQQQFSLTEAGEVLYACARQLLQVRDDALIALNAIHERSRSTIISAQTTQPRCC